jgi:hypothetical protein
VILAVAVMPSLCRNTALLLQIVFICAEIVFIDCMTSRGENAGKNTNHGTRTVLTNFLFDFGYTGDRNK